MALHTSHETMDTVEDMNGDTVTVVMWPCDVCGAQFSRQSKLEKHRLCHSNPQIIVVTPSGLRLTAEQVTLQDGSWAPNSTDIDITYIDPVDE